MDQAKQRYCSGSLEKRFWFYVDTASNHLACWPWTGSTDARGYGQVYGSGGPPLKAHRVSWELNRGLIPLGLHVLHFCDNRKCCNPAHLFLGTNADNVADRERKGRRRTGHMFGEIHGMAKVTEAAVLEMIYFDACGTRRCEIAQAFGLSRAQVSDILNKKSWRHLWISAS